MSYIIRCTFVLGFIISAISLTACGVSVAEKRSAAEPDRPLIEPETKDERPKIIAFGDSLTAGFGLSEQESYPYLLQKRLDAEGYDYQVKNLGVSGETSLGGVERIDWVLEHDNIEILILELGANDLLRGMPVENMKKNLDRIITKARAKDIEILLCGMIALPSMGAEYQRNYTAAFAELAEKHDVAFVPFLLEGVALNPKLNQADGIHPNARGTEIMTENIYRELKPLLER